MRGFQQKSKWRNIMESWPVLGLFGIIILVFAWSVVSFLSKMQTARQNRALAEAKVVELEAKKAQLSSDIEKLQTDEGKEEIFRENFGLAKAGEGLTVVVDDKEAIQSKVKSDDRGFFSWLKFWNWFD